MLEQSAGREKGVVRGFSAKEDTTVVMVGCRRQCDTRGDSSIDLGLDSVCDGARLGISTHLQQADTDSDSNENDTWKKKKKIP